MLLHCSPQFFCVLHTPLVFCPVSVTFLLCFHSSPVFSALHLSSLLSIALSTVLSTISARRQHHSFFYYAIFCETNLQQLGLCFLYHSNCCSCIFIIFDHYIVWRFNHFTFPTVKSYCGNAFHQWLQLIHPCPPCPPAPHIREQQAFVWCFVPCLFLWVSLVVFQFCSFDSLTFAFLWILPFVYLFRYPIWTHAFSH